MKMKILYIVIVISTLSSCTSLPKDYHLFKGKVYVVENNCANLMEKIKKNGR